MPEATLHWAIALVSRAIDFVTKSVVTIACAAASDPVSGYCNQLGIPDAEYPWNSFNHTSGGQ